MASLTPRGKKIATAIHEALAKAFTQLGDLEAAAAHSKAAVAGFGKASKRPKLRVMIGGIR
jgi:hypothetical protein